jgi:hypothetical protein
MKESSLNTDLSVAPEIARLAMAFIPARPGPAAPRTDGRIAGDLADLAAAPQRWWDLVRFDRDRPLRIPVPDAPGTWLLVLPPGAVADCHCRQATALAGEAVETGTVETGGAATGDDETRAGGPADSGRPLRPGRVRVHGTGSPHRVRSAGHGYSVSLHATGAPVRSAEIQGLLYRTVPWFPFLRAASGKPAFIRLQAER